ncbi:hypothetical protein V8C37DRAFT_391216 [Trichoderma ceciliae]
MASAMETINQLATSAAKAVWGDSNAPETHKEPISGATGDVSKGEPYDAGNLDAKDQSKVESNLSREAAKTAPNESSDLADDEHYALSSSTKDREHGEHGEHGEPPNASETNGPRSTADDVNPEEGKPLDELTGEGPRPVEVVAKERGGNAAAVAGDAESSPSAPGETKPGADGEQENEQREATEEEYVKATGLAADGGDFDASKPGAGLDADRLMEQKGIQTEHTDTKGGGSSSHDSHDSHGRKSSDSNHHHKDKRSLGERIKNKLHKH